MQLAKLGKQLLLTAPAVAAGLPRLFASSPALQGISVWQRVVRPTAFCVGVSAASYGLAGYLTEQKYANSEALPWQHKQRGGWLSRLPESVQGVIAPARARWERLPEAYQTTWGIVLLNGVVFLGWRIPRLQRFMQRHFMHDAKSGRVHTMLTSTFSHKEGWHYLLNMVALLSFGSLAHQALGKEQFLALYISGGLAASLTSQLATTATLRRMAAAVPTHSLGASGAVLSCVMLAAVYYPQTSVALIFLPWVAIPIRQAMFGLMALDATGAALGWRTFDHFAHLGGAAYGFAASLLMSSQQQRRQRESSGRRVQ